jgi:hypothetical protein
VAAIGGFVQTADHLYKLFFASPIVSGSIGAALWEREDCLENFVERFGQIDFDLFHDDLQNLSFRSSAG